jgi:hypothetical protein
MCRWLDLCEPVARQASALLSAALPMTIARPRSSGMSGAAAASGKPVLPAVSEEKCVRAYVVRCLGLVCLCVRGPVGERRC